MKTYLQQHNRGFIPKPNLEQSLHKGMYHKCMAVICARFNGVGKHGLRPQHKNWCRGFTLVEMLVSISIFTIVITMSVGTLLVLIDANGRAQSMQLVMTNLSFSLDSMTREIRTGFNWYCDARNTEESVPTHLGDDEDSVRDCSIANPGNYFSIVESGSSLTDNITDCDTTAELANCSHRVTYWFDKDKYGTGHGAIVRRLGDDSENGEWIPLTGSDISVDEMRLVVTGTERYTIDPLNPDNTEQPTATLYLKGRAGFDATGNNAKVREFEMQTTVTQRVLDI